MGQKKTRSSCLTPVQRCFVLAVGLLVPSYVLARIIVTPLQHAFASIRTPRHVAKKSLSGSAVSRPFGADYSFKARPNRGARLPQVSRSALRRDVLASGASAVAGPDTFVLKSEEKKNVDLFDRNSPGVVFITNEEITFLQSNESIDVYEKDTAGTGWIYDKEGRIVTNLHVVKGASNLVVRFIDGTQVNATVVGADPGTDVAVLQVNVPPKASSKLLQPLTRGCSGNLKVGQEVFAIGNPFGLDQTLTKGIISAVGRTVPSKVDSGRPIQGAIQTDAAINPGNSGGPLFNTDGNVVGMNTEIISPSGASAGIGFAIPIDTVSARVLQILKYGYVKRPSLGLYLGADGIAQRVSGQAGGVVAGLQSPSAAGRAGIRSGDIILQIDDTRTKTINDVYAALDMHQPGETVTLQILRPQTKDMDNLQFNQIRVDVMLLEASAGRARP